MSNPQFDQHFHKVQSVLGSHAEEGWVFGVCSALARRTGWDLWAIRLGVVIALLVASIATVLVYFAVAMMLDEVRPRAQARMRCWARKADQLVEKLWSLVSDPATPDRRT